MVLCESNCEGIYLSRRKGVIPRCLAFEHRDRLDATGSAVVGINPGQAKREQQTFYLKKGCTYENTRAWWGSHKDGRYYGHLREFVDLLGFNGPILWTELVKCQNKDKGKSLPLQTYRTCTAKYLNKELELLPESWPLIAIGRESYKALAYLYPTRTVIGIPHPTSSRGQFHSLFLNNLRTKFDPNVQKILTQIMNCQGSAHWLSSRNS